MKNAVLLIVGVLIGLAIGIFGGYYYFENFSDKEFSKEVKQEEKKKEEPKEETKVWTDEEVQNILSLFFKNTRMSTATATKDITDADVFTSITYMILFDLDSEEYGVVKGDETGNVYALSIPLDSI